MYNNIIPYKQVTKLNRYNNCRLEFKTCDVKSLFFWFDQLENVIPTEVTLINGKENIKYTYVDVIEITDDEKSDGKIGYDNCLMLYYKNDNIKRYRNLLKEGESFKSLIGYHIIDWNNNVKLINSLKDRNSEYIELNYYIEK